MRALLHLTNRYHRPLPDVPFTYGVPVPEGAARTPADLALLDGAGQPVPLAVQPLATWPDGSLRWALLDFVGSFAPNEQADWTLTLGEGAAPPPPAKPVTVDQTAAGIRVRNGPLEAFFSQGRFRLVNSLTADGVEIIGPAHGGDIVAVSPAGKIFRASCDPAPKLSVEDVTPLRAVVRWDGGLFAGDGTRLTGYRLKLSFFAGNPYVKIEHAAICRELPETGVLIREYSLELETAQDSRTTKVVRQRIHGVDNFSRLVELTQNVRILVPTKGAETQPTEQIGILGAVGKPVLEDESAFGEEVGSFPHFLQPGAPRLALGGGYAMVFPFLGVRDARRTVVASILRMAPQHPKGLAADENRLTFEIWPAGHGSWRLCRGMTKTHHLALSWFGRALSAEEIEAEAVRREFFAHQELGDPVSITLEPDYVRLTRQVEAHKLLPRLPQRYPKLETKIEGIQLHGQPLAYAGMMDYGEAIATNNEEDQGHEYAMEYYRRGAYDQYQKLVAQMLHNSTVDVVDWDPDPLRQGGTPYCSTANRPAPVTCWSATASTPATRACTSSGKSPATRN